MSVFTSLLNNTFDHARRRRTPDGQGGWAIDYVALAAFEGRMRPASSSEREAAQVEGREITHVLYVACVQAQATEDIVRGDRITLEDLVVDVLAVREPSLAGEHLEIECRERQFEETVAEGS